MAKVEGGERQLDVVEFITLLRALGADPVAALGEIAALVDAPQAGAGQGR